MRNIGKRTIMKGTCIEELWMLGVQLVKSFFNTKKDYLVFLYNIIVKLKRVNNCFLIKYIWVQQPRATLSLNWHSVSGQSSNHDIRSYVVCFMYVPSMWNLFCNHSQRCEKCEIWLVFNKYYIKETWLTTTYYYLINEILKTFYL